MTSVEPCSSPSDVAAEAGEVIVEGPDGVAVTMTADAAEETARRMMEAASEARRQTEAGTDELDQATRTVS
jgi:hypothetical protein